MKIKYLLWCLLLSGATRALAQTPNAAAGTAAATTPAATTAPAPATDDFANDKQPIVYSFIPTDPYYLRFNRVLPFDKTFSIRFTGIPTSVSSIKVTITREYPNRKGQASGGKHSSAPPEEVIVLDGWQRGSGSEAAAATIGYAHCAKGLAPNASYSIRIETSGEVPLNATQQTQLKTGLAVSRAVSEAVNKLARTSLGTLLPADAIINQENTDLQQSLTTAVTDIDPKYHVSKLEPIKALEAFQGMLDNYRNIRASLAKVTQKLKSDNKFSSKTQAIANLEQTMLNTTDWGIFSTNGLDHTAFLAVLDGIDKDTAIVKNAGVHAVVSSGITDTKKYLNQVEPLKDALVKQIIDVVIIPNITVFETLDDTYVDDFLKASKLYVTLDLGYAQVFRIDRGLAYSGFNLYFRPVDKSIPLSQYSTIGDWFAVRTSLLIGITLNSIAQDNVRKGLIGDKALVVGAGFKLVPFFKLNGGVLVHYRYGENPSLGTNHYHTSLSPFVSFSIDLDAKTLFSGIGDSIFK
ncbi:hypothetical protein PQ469_30765 [Mucilaginibacter sp. KACC 22773]|uniref:hypothetical protein n=1 Tax=Mucilaginibacter sp. KACC 22773 TaxID=3025671 RepID=UPI0023662C5A|nr:hypothetical protein [Mucilaginibacter sp. KACC 22773]WDF78272.1 hypothetical protein PQ469_30765 [Mucilaginibacter sp. KACC 22773]